MSTIEERVVAMKFQGEQFLAGVDKSLHKIDQFNNKIKTLGEGAKNFDNVSAAARRQHDHLSKISEGIQHISDRFKAMGVIATTALATIAHQAIFAGQNLAKSLTVEPIIQGFREYETNLNSIQTILANTQAAGTKLSDVTKALDELNHYSDQTIYNFSQMAKNIGTFTAAGVGLKPATAAIKGIANLAALSGSNSEQAAAAMYQLSQAISAGQVSLEDWNSVVNAGMGGTVFQRALAQTAVAMGKLEKGAVKLTGPMKNVQINGEAFRKSISAVGGKASWLTSDVLTKTLAQFTGDLKDAELAAMGFNKEQIKAIQAQAKMAKAAATEVKTLSQLMGTLKESAGSGWSQTWKTIFGDFPEAKKLFSSVNEVVGGFISSSADARNKVLSDWKKLGGRTAMLQAISNTFKGLVSVVKPIKDAFRDIFPATTGKQLASWSKSIRDFTANLSISGTTAGNLKSTFKGFFAILDIGRMIIVGLVGMIFDLLGITTEGAGGILEFTGNIGDWIVKVRDAIKSGEGLSNFFDGLGKVLAVPIKIIKGILALIGFLVSKAPSIDSALSPLGKIGALASMAWEKVLGAVTSVWDKMEGFRTWAGGFFGDLGNDIAEMVSGLDFKDVLAGINTGMFAGIVLMLRNLIGGGGAGGIMKSISDGFDNLTGALGAMQNTLRAATLLQIAVAVGILAIAMNTLSKIDAAGLTRASAAITVMFTQLLGSLLLFEKMSGFTGFAKMPFIAASMILMAVAVNILASAVKKLADLGWEELAKGLTGVTVLIGGLIGAMHLMPNPAGMISSALGMILMAAAIKILVSAVTDLSGLSWEDLSKGLIGVGAILAGLTLFTKFGEANAGGLLQGAGLLLLAVGIRILADAVTKMAGLSWGEIARGLVTMAGAMTIMVLSLSLIPPTAPLAAAGVLGVAISMGMIADALAKLGEMSWGEIAKGLTTMLGAMTIISLALAVIPPTAVLGAAGVLIVAVSLGMIGSALEKFAGFSWEEIGKAMVVLAGSLGIIAGAMMLMSGALPGAAALIVVAGALAILTPVLIALGGMSWEEIGKGLVALAGAFLVIGVAGALLTPVIPTLLGFGAAVALLGVGLALTGAGVFLFATGLTLLAASGVAAAGALVGMIEVLLGALPKIVQLVEALLSALLDLVINMAPKLGQAAIVLIGTLITVIGNLTPRIINMILKLLQALLDALVKHVPKMVDAGYQILTGFLKGIAKRLPGVISAAVDVIVAFINGISSNLGRVIQAGINLVINFVNGLANAIRSNSERMRAAGLNLAMAIIDGMTGGLASGVGRIVDKAKEIASSALNAAKNILGIKSPSKEFEKIGKYVNDGFRKGLDGNKGQVNTAFKNLRSQLSAGYKAATEDIATLEKRLRRLRSARKKDLEEIRETTKALAQARSERTKTSSTLAFVNKNYKDEQAALGRLADRYDVLTKKIKDAQDTLDNAIKTRDDFNKRIADQFSDVASPTGETKVQEYIDTLEKQLENTKTLSNDLQLLRKMGLRDELYEDLLATGTSALPFVKELLAGGQKSIDQINALDKELDSVAGSLGKTASNQLYQAAVDSAAGLVKGLKDQQAAIEKQMDAIADAMVRSIKKKLGIKSPSLIFAQVGKYSAEGLSMGLKNKADIVADAASSVGEKAVEAMRISLSNVDKMVAGNIDLQPTIRPVLDLTDIRRNAGKLGTLLPSDSKMTVDTSYSNAASVAAAVRDRFDGDDLSGTGGTGGAMLNYVQNNFSPKALSTVEIYRGTKNQLSTVKGALST